MGGLELLPDLVKVPLSEAAGKDSNRSCRRSGMVTDCSPLVRSKLPGPLPGAIRHCDCQPARRDNLRNYALLSPQSKFASQDQLYLSDTRRVPRN